MRRFLIALSLLGAVAGGWGETLGLTIHNDNGDPGLARSVWTHQFFVDDKGRVARERRVVGPQFIGEAPTITERFFHWEDDGVWWEDTLSGGTQRTEYRFADRGRIEVQTTKASPSEPEQRDAWTVLWSDEGGITWEWGHFRARWSRTNGYSAARLPEPQAQVEEVQCRTDGSKMTFWTNGHEYSRILIDRSPRSLKGIFVTQNEALDAWITTGEVLLTGPGLWTPRTEQNVVHALIAMEPLAVPLIFEKNYLR